MACAKWMHTSVFLYAIALLFSPLYEKFPILKVTQDVADFPHFLDGVKTMEMTEVWKLAGILHKIGYFYQDMEDDIWNT